MLVYDVIIAVLLGKREEQGRHDRASIPPNNHRAERGENQSDQRPFP